VKREDDASKTDEQIALDNCEREPVHIPGRVQSFGVLVATDCETFEITYVSRNVTVLGIEHPEQVLGSRIETLFPDSDLIHAIRGAMGIPTIATQREYLGRYTINDVTCDMAVHISADMLVLESEPISGTFNSPSVVTAQVRSLMMGLTIDQGVDQLLLSGVKALRMVTGFDRIMGYRFLENGDGEVVAEVCSPALTPYLGLRYPASDIPKQVRDIMLKIPIRLIPNIRVAQAEVFSIRDQPLDLTRSHNRGVSPIHVEYLSNMGVAAAMNLSIIVRGELWGLFAFHHNRPKLLPMAERFTGELFAQFFSMQLQQEIEKEVLRGRKRANSILESIRKTEDTALDAAVKSLWEPMAEILNADGVALARGQGTARFGSTPSEQAILAISTSPHEYITTFDSFASVAEVSSMDLGQSAGALAMTIGNDDDTRLFFFRDEEILNVRWGGEPKKEISFGPNGPRLHPRASFEEYAESVHGRCCPWSKIELATAAELRNSIVELVYREQSATSQAWKKQKKYQDILIAELNHRVKNVLALVRSIARQSRDSSTSLESYAAAFERRILALATAHDLIGGSGLQWARLDEMLQTELKPFVDQSERVEIDGPPLGLRADISPVMALVFHELVSNSNKHGVMGRDEGRLRVSWQSEASGTTIRWQESGLDNVQQPTRRGFGLTLIERAIPYECRGTAKVDFRSDGFMVTFWLPAETTTLMEKSHPHVEQANDASAAAITELAKTYERVLIVEDNMVLALDLEKTLVSLGVRAIDAVPSIELSRQYLVGNKKYDFAVLDVNLRNETSVTLALELLERNVPFVFVTGYEKNFEYPDALKSVPILAKPVEIEALATAINLIAP